MMTIGEIIKWRQESGGLSLLLGIEVKDVQEGSASVECKLTPPLLNPLGMAHGGTIYTLCDVAAGTAAATRGRIAVTLNGNINYLRPAKADICLRAVAEERKAGRSTAVYAITVYDEENSLIADATFTMFYTGELIENQKCLAD